MYPRVTSFRSRRSTLTDKQQQTWDRLWPRIGTQARTGDIPAGRLDTAAWFGRSAPVLLEIGKEQVYGAALDELPDAQRLPAPDERDASHLSPLAWRALLADLGCRATRRADGIGLEWPAEVGYFLSQ